jgi:hypothetical protein
MALPNEVLIDDVTCCDCGGRCEATFVLPNKVWDGLGFALGAFACFACIARRLNPNNPPQDADQLTEEIYRQRRRFKLKRINKFLGHKLEGYLSTLTIEESIKSIPKLAMLQGRNALNVPLEEYAEAMEKVCGKEKAQDWLKGAKEKVAMDTTMKRPKGNMIPQQITLRKFTDWLKEFGIVEATLGTRAHEYIRGKKDINTIAADPHVIRVFHIIPTPEANAQFEKEGLPPLTEGTQSFIFDDHSSVEWRSETKDVN